VAERAELERIRLDPALTNNTKVGGRKVTGTRELAKKVVIATATQRSKAQNPHGTKNSKRKKHATIARGEHLVLVSSLPNGSNPPTNVMAYVRTTFKIVTDDDGQLLQSKRTSTVPRPACDRAASTLKRAGGRTPGQSVPTPPSLR